MTREFRETAIRNYLIYLSSVYQQTILSERLPKRTVLFAFSQDVSTFIRWVVQENTPFDKMVLGVGDLPADVG